MGSQKNSRVRARAFCIVLYPDDEKHMFLLDWLCTWRKVVYVLHDRDKYLASDVNDTTVTPDMVGTLKKSHYHVIIYFQNARSLKSVQSELTEFYNFNTDRTSNFHVEVCSDVNSYISYLTHTDLKSQYLGKSIYTQDELHGDLALISSSLNYNLDNRSIVSVLCNKIISEKLPFWKFTQWVTSSDTDRVFFDCFMKNQYVFRNLCYDLGFDKN